MPLPKPVYTAEDYWALPKGTRAELIDGELWDLAAPSRIHQKIVFELGRRLADFIDAHHGSCEVYPAPFAVNLFGDDSTFVEPDISVVCDPSKLSDRGCEGAPDIVIEVVSPSSGQMDYISKPALYQQAGVREYWICDPRKERTLVYGFGSGEEDGPLSLFPFTVPVQSAVLSGFEINIGSILA